MLVENLNKKRREEFDRMLNQPTPDEIRRAARQMALESKQPKKVPPSWW